MSEWFQVVELEVNSLCNRVCDYCPVAVLPKVPPVPKFMSDEVIDRLLSELARIEYQGRVSYHFYNEPLVRKDLEKIIRRAREALPLAFQLLYTNGDLLTDERQRSLIAAGLDHTLVTRHQEGAYPSRVDQTVQFARELVFTNRAGLMSNIAKVAEPLHKPCFAPTDMLIVGTNGDVLLCCDDAQRTEVMGNILDQRIDEIWHSERMTRIRRLLQEGRRGEATAACAKCSNSEYFARGESFWPDPFKDHTGWVPKPTLRAR